MRLGPQKTVRGLLRSPGKSMRTGWEERTKMWEDATISTIIKIVTNITNYYE